MKNDTLNFKVNMTGMEIKKSYNPQRFWPEPS